MIKPKIAVLAGGYSGEYGISIQSATEVLENIDPSRFSPMLVRIESEDSWFVYHSEKEYSNIDKSNFTWLDSSGDTQAFDIAFIMVHGTPGEDGILQKYFENLQIPFTTGSSDSVSTTFNKYLTNNKLRQEGLLVANSYLVEKGNLLDHDELKNIINRVSPPCFIKPNHGGSSIGISKVLTKEEILPAINQAFTSGTPSVLIESLLIGKEFSVGVIPGHNGHPQAMPITEIISENDFFDYAAKYEGESQEITPAKISNELVDKIQLNALKAYKILNCRGMVRVDFIVINKNQPAILEINSVPGFTKMSLLPQQLAHAEINVKDLLSRIIESSLTN
jgi:D-alanine-D-alanine ligase